MPAGSGGERDKMNEFPVPAVLVVDDNDQVRDLAVEILTEAGYQTMGAGSAVEAIRHLTAKDFDLIFTDIAMPGLSGFALARQAKQLQPGLRVVYTTGFIPPDEWDELRYGRVLRKPYSPRQLAAEIAKALEK
jgi:CheY-like chemotaxis protein